MCNVGVKSTKLYEIKSFYGLKHELSLVFREYKYGKSIYILKLIETYYKKGIQYKMVSRLTFTSRDEALNVLKNNIYILTIDNINFQLSLPF